MAYAPRAVMEVGYGEFKVPSPEPAVNAVEAKYMRNYAVGICNAILALFGEDDLRAYFGSFENCVRTFERAADQFFDMWKIKWLPALAAKARAAS